MTHPRRLVSLLSRRGGRCVRSPADNPGRRPGGSVPESHQPGLGQGACDTRGWPHVQLLEGATGSAAYANLYLQCDERRRVSQQWRETGAAGAGPVRLRAALGKGGHQIQSEWYRHLQSQEDVHL